MTVTPGCVMFFTGLSLRTNPFNPEVLLFSGNTTHILQHETKKIDFLMYSENLKSIIFSFLRFLTVLWNYLAAFLIINSSSIY